MATESQLEQVISLLRNAGFEPAGYASARVIGEIDGKEIILSPRKRYIKPYTNIRVTTGLQITFFYTINEYGEVVPLERFRTIDIKKISAYLKK